MIISHIVSSVKLPSGFFFLPTSVTKRPSWDSRWFRSLSADGRERRERGEETMPQRLTLCGLSTLNCSAQPWLWLRFPRMGQTRRAVVVVVVVVWSIGWCSPRWRRWTWHMWGEAVGGGGWEGTGWRHEGRDIKPSDVIGKRARDERGRERGGERGTI